MHHQQPQNGEQGSLLSDLKNSFNVFHFFMQVLSLPLRPWLTRFGTWGECFCGIQMGVGLALAFVGPTLCFPQADPRPLLCFWMATIGLLVVHRIAGVWRRSRGYRCHSQYTGTPWIRGEEVKVKSHTEVGIVALIGAFACALSPALGVYLIVAGFAQGFCVATGEERDKARLRAMRDARYEQLYYLRRYREEVEEEEE